MAILAKRPVVTALNKRWI